MKKTSLIPVVFFVFCFFVSSAFAEEKINNFRSTIHINTNGTIDVEEKIVYDFGDTEHHGIYRDIPYTITNPDGKKFNIELRDFSVKDETERKYTYDKSTASGTVHLKIGDANRYVTGIHTYIIRYKALGALRYFSNHDELYWNITGSGWGIPMRDVQATVILPSTINGAQLKIACYTGPAGSKASDCSFHTDSQTVYYSAKYDFSPYEGMTVVAGFPKGMVTLLEPKQVFSQTPLGIFLTRLALFGAALAALWWYIMYPIKIAVKWFKHGRDPRANVGVVRAGFDPPTAPNGDPLTPSETGALLDETVDQRDIAALMVDLARRGHLRIEERKKKDFYLVQTASKEKRTLLNFEKDLLDGIFATGKDIRLKDQQYKLSTTVSDIKKSIYDRLVKNGFFPKNPDTTRNFYAGMAAVGVITGNILLIASAILFGRKIPQKTQAGSDARNIAQSLKNFLGSQERQLEFQAKNQMMFEKLLPYAVAFGVEDIWAKRFEDLEMKPPGWYSGYNSSGTFRSTYLSQSLGDSFSSLSRATATVSSTGSSSGFSGGSSGGGGGGGGGGSW
jgi:hypothetical protein